MPTKRIRCISSAMVLLCGMAYGQESKVGDLSVDQLRQLLEEQSRKLEAEQKNLAEQEGKLRESRQRLDETRRQLEQLKVQAGLAAPPAAASAPSTPPSPAAQVEQAQQPVGQAPQRRDNRPPEVAPIFEQPGVLTPKGKFALEPSVQYSYSSSNRVSLVGFTIIPAILIGLIDVREVKRNTFTGALTARYGLTNRFEVEAKLPYVYRNDSTVSREVFTGTAVDRVFEASGHGVGDAEFTGRYQFNDGGLDKPYFIGTLRLKTRTGKDPFEVVTDCVQRCIGNTNITGTGLPIELPTGSGFYGIQPGLTWLFPSDPAVFFGSFSYLHSLKRNNVTRHVVGGTEQLGTVELGDIFGFNFGMGLALNERSSFSIGYDHNSVGKTKQNGSVVPGSVTTQLGTLLLGYSYRYSDKTTLSVSVGAGLTRDTPDVTLNFRLPMSF